MRRIWIRRRGKRNERRMRSMNRNSMIRMRRGRKKSWMGRRRRTSSSRRKSKTRRWKRSRGMRGRRRVGRMRRGEGCGRGE